MNSIADLLKGGVGLVVAPMLLAGCSYTLSRAFYSNHPMSSAEVAKVWGEPFEVQQLDG